MSYERHGIVVITVTLRREAALAASKKLDETIRGYEAMGGGDPDGLATLREFETMVREVLSGAPGQVMPLKGADTSPFDAILGRPS